MKILLLSNTSPNQVALGHKIDARFPIAAQVLVQPGSRRPTGMAQVRALTRRIANAAVGRPLAQAWQALQRHYAGRYPQLIDVHTQRTGDVNSVEVLDLVDRIRPDLTIVSGTNLLRQPLIDRLSDSGPVMNLHTGISPFIKGGPNCTNWCLAIDRPDLIGNTIMWIDAGIDSGRLITTEATPIQGVSTLTDLHLRVMEHAHDLYMRAIERFVAGSPLPAIDQSELPDHRLFLTRDWTAGRMVAAQRHFSRYTARQFAQAATRAPYRLIPMLPLARALQ